MSQTPAVEDYLKAIYLLQQDTPTVSTSALVEHLGDRKPGSVSGMLKKLAEQELIEHTPYHGVRLTPCGEQAALHVLRQHRLIELYLVKALGYGWDEVHEEAEALEHYLSDKLVARIAAHLGNPSYDPHGDPIPSSDGALPVQPRHRLNELAVGTRACVVRVCTQHAERLRYLAALGLTPGAQLEITAVAPFGGPISVRTPSTMQPLDLRLAHSIVVDLVQ